MGTGNVYMYNAHRLVDQWAKVCNFSVLPLLQETYTQPKGIVECDRVR